MRYIAMVIALGMLLLSSYGYTGLDYIPASAVSKTALRSTISLDSLEGYPVTQGSSLIFTGTLIEGSGKGIPDTTINIIQQIAFDNEQEENRMENYLNRIVGNLRRRI